MRADSLVSHPATNPQNFRLRFDLETKKKKEKLCKGSYYGLNCPSRPEMNDRYPAQVGLNGLPLARRPWATRTAQRGHAAGQVNGVLFDSKE
jgi:hypothetical protein